MNKKVTIVDCSFHIWNGTFANKTMCECSYRDENNKVRGGCDRCDNGWIFLNANGFKTGGLYQISKLAQGALERDNEVILVFDPPKSDLTNTQLLSDYKGNRKETPPEIKAQKDFALQFFPMLDQLKCYLGITDESDDVMARLAIEYKKDGYDVVVATDDKDLFCVLAHGVKLYRQKEIFTYENFIQKFGFTPDRHDEYLAITGDAADNFNLIVGLGPVAATYFINNFDNILDIFDDGNWERVPSKYKKKLIKICDETKREIFLKEELETSLKLAKLNLNADYKEIKNEVSLSEIHDKLNFLKFRQMKENLNLFHKGLM